MMWCTHLTTGLTAGYLVTGLDPALAAAGLASLLPDIDSPSSYVSNKIPVLPEVIRLLSGHRGFFHSITAAVIISVLCFIYAGKNFAIAAGAGYLTHLAGDMLTCSGISLFWPFRKKISIPLVKTGGILEKLVIMPVSVILLIKVFS